MFNQSGQRVVNQVNTFKVEWKALAREAPTYDGSYLAYCKFHPNEDRETNAHAERIVVVMWHDGHFWPKDENYENQIDEFIWCWADLGQINKPDPLLPGETYVEAV